jgi:hypothetical protein
MLAEALLERCRTIPIMVRAMKPHQNKRRQVTVSGRFCPAVQSTLTGLFEGIKFVAGPVSFPQFLRRLALGPSLAEGRAKTRTPRF